ncbi:MAG: efflux RND transporter periplasmic adaptor subunit [Ignavibacteriae bacterium]|nr:efflux RND transporter periplasmic adaptor subunit [Ignavibacteriota bacterium]
MKKLFLVSAIFLMLIFTACEEETKQKNEKIVPVKVYTVKLDNIENFVKATGTIAAGEDVIVFSKVSEKIVKVFVKPGDKISQGQTIALQYNALFKQSVAAAETAVKSAQTQFNLAQQEFNRMKNLFDQKAISSQQFDQIKTQYESAELGLQASKVQLQQAKEQFDNSYIKSPFNGTIASIYIEQNQMVAAGLPIAQIINSNSMKAKVKIPSDEIGKIFKEQSVSIEFPSIPNKIFEGIVSEIDQAVDPISKNLQVEISLIKPGGSIKSGMFGEFLIKTSIKDNSIIIPENSIQSRTEVKIDRETGLQKSIKKYFVFVIKNGKANLIEVKTGISSDGRIEILSGLNVGDTIVVVGQNIVKSGDKVKIID